MIVAPLDNNITVFNKGSSKGFTGSIPKGGHWAPNSTVGVRALWKNAQKMAKKNNASETIKRITPKLSPLCTAKVWSPKKVASDIISLNQKDIEHTNKYKAKYIKIYPLEKLCIDRAVLVVNEKREILV